MITNPIDLKTIQTRMHSGEYATLGALSEALEAVWANAQVYNEEGSQVHEDAAELRRIMKNAMRVSSMDVVIRLRLEFYSVIHLNRFLASSFLGWWVGGLVIQ